jgi:hypothetical protein
MPTMSPGGLLHYDLDDPADLAVLIERGLIWHGGPKALSAALRAIVGGHVPRPANVPPRVAALLDRIEADRRN